MVGEGKGEREKGGADGEVFTLDGFEANNNLS